MNAPGVAAPDLARTLEQGALEHHTVAARNVTPDAYAAVRRILPGVQYHAGAQMLLFTDDGADVPKPARLPGRVAVICGTGRDLHCAFEATVSLSLTGAYGSLYQGVSAADLPSLVRVRQSVADADVVIVCCGEQPALAGLVAGMVACPIVAIPGAGCTDPHAAMSVAGAPPLAARETLRRARPRILR